MADRSLQAKFTHSLLEQLPPNVFPHIWEALDAASRKSLYGTNKNLQGICLQHTRALTFRIPQDLLDCASAVFSLHFPPDVLSLLPKDDFKVTIDLVHEGQVGQVSPSCPFRLARFLSHARMDRVGAIISSATHLKLLGATVDDTMVLGIVHVCAGAQRLRVLDIRGALTLSVRGNLTDKAVPVDFSPLIQLGSLTTLRCEVDICQSFGAAHSSTFRSMLGLQSLKHLRYQAGVGDHIIETAEAELFKCLPDLETLELRGCILEDGAVEVLASLTNLTKLAVFQLRPLGKLPHVPWRNLYASFCDARCLGQLPLGCLDQLDLNSGGESGRIFIYVQREDTLEDMRTAAENLRNLPAVSFSFGPDVSSWSGDFSLLEPLKTLPIVSLVLDKVSEDQVSYLDSWLGDSVKSLKTSGPDGYTTDFDDPWPDDYLFKRALPVFPKVQHVQVDMPLVPMPPRDDEVAGKVTARLKELRRGRAGLHCVKVHHLHHWEEHHWSQWREALGPGVELLLA